MDEAPLNEVFQPSSHCKSPGRGGTSVYQVGHPEADLVDIIPVLVRIVPKANLETRTWVQASSLRAVPGSIVRSWEDETGKGGREMKGITTRDSVGYSELPSHMGAGAGVSVLLAPFCTGGGSLLGYQLPGASSLASTLGPGMLPWPENGLRQETWGAAGVYKTPFQGSLEESTGWEWALTAQSPSYR